MEKKNTIIMWTTLSTCLVLAMAHHVDNAANINSIRKSGDSDSLETKPFVKYMIELYNIMFGKNGQPMKGIATMDDDMSCFLPEVSTSNSKSSLTFDIRELKKDEQIIKAYLIFPIEQPASIRSATRLSPVNAADSKDSTPNPLNLSGREWKLTEVTSKVKSWHKRRHKKNTILVGPGNDKNMQASFLVVHSRSNTKSSKVGENQKANLSKRDQRSHYTRSSNSQSCRKEKMVVDVTATGYDKRIISPSIFNAYRCEGTCGPIFSTASKHETWHSRFQALKSASYYNKQDGERVKLPCCTPAEYKATKALMMKYNSRDGKLAAKTETLTDLVVKSCGCF